MIALPIIWKKAPLCHIDTEVQYYTHLFASIFLQILAGPRSCKKNSIGIKHIFDLFLSVLTICNNLVPFFTAIKSSQNPLIILELLFFKILWLLERKSENAFKNPAFRRTRPSLCEGLVQYEYWISEEIQYSIHQSEKHNMEKGGKKKWNIFRDWLLHYWLPSVCVPDAVRLQRRQNL